MPFRLAPSFPQPSSSLSFSSPYCLSCRIRRHFHASISSLDPKRPQEPFKIRAPTFEPATGRQLSNSHSRLKEIERAEYLNSIAEQWRKNDLMYNINSQRFGLPPPADLEKRVPRPKGLERTKPQASHLRPRRGAEARGNGKEHPHESTSDHRDGEVEQVMKSTQRLQSNRPSSGAGGDTPRFDRQSSSYNAYEDYGGDTMRSATLGRSRTKSTKATEYDTPRPRGLESAGVGLGNPGPAGADRSGVGFNVEIAERFEEDRSFSDATRSAAQEPRRSPYTDSSAHWSSFTIDAREYGPIEASGRTRPSFLTRPGRLSSQRDQLGDREKAPHLFQNAGDLRVRALDQSTSAPSTASYQSIPQKSTRGRGDFKPSPIGSRYRDQGSSSTSLAFPDIEGAGKRFRDDQQADRKPFTNASFSSRFAADSPGKRSGHPGRETSGRPARETFDLVSGRRSFSTVSAEVRRRSMRTRLNETDSTPNTGPGRTVLNSRRPQVDESFRSPRPYGSSPPSRFGKLHKSSGLTEAPPTSPTYTESTPSRSWQPTKKLTFAAMAGLKALHRGDPEKYSRAFLRDKFKISDEAVRRILKSNWREQQTEKGKTIEARPATRAAALAQGEEMSLTGTKWDSDPTTAEETSSVPAILRAFEGRLSQVRPASAMKLVRNGGEDEEEVGLAIHGSEEGTFSKS